MKKPDIFDEILKCLRENELTHGDPYLPEDVAKEFYAPPVQRERKNAISVSPEREKQDIDVPPQPRQEIRIAPSLSVKKTPVQLVAASSSDLKQDEFVAEVMKADLTRLTAMVQACHRCRLCSTRKNVVVHDGNPAAKLMFIGEGPGADEDEQGVPFVGRAGELLSKMIAAMGFDRKKDTYIANIVKCRPPGNINPKDDEAEFCLPFLKRQIEIVNPEVIILLGAVPLKYLLGMTGITVLHGKWLTYQGIKVMPTYHPAYLLRRQDMKKFAWQDLQTVMAHFGKKPPVRS